MFVVDASALNAVPDLTVDEGQAFNALTDLVAGGEVVFCDEVIAELAHLAKDEPPHVWARAVRDSRTDKGAPYQHVDWVLVNVPDILDPDVEFDLCAPYVLAQARHLSAGKVSVAVVTEDTIDKPTRISLISACGHVGIATMGLVDCFNTAGLSGLCL